MSMRFQTLPTPNPNERKFRVLVDDKFLKPSNLPTLGTTYGNWTLDAKERIDEGWNDYVYLKSDNAGEAGMSSFLFGKAHTAEQRLTAFRSYTIYEKYTWPAVLLALGIMQDGEAPIQYYDAATSSYTAKHRPFVRAMYQPSAFGEWRCLREEFLSSTPYTQVELSHNQPVPSEISWDILGSQGAYEKCLHPEVKFRETQTQATVSSDMGTENAPQVFGGNKVQQFPATNFSTWRKFTLKDSQEEVDGQFYRVKITIFPPRDVPQVTGAV